MSERVEFLTKDGVKIVGDYYNPEHGASSELAVLLLHMMPSNRKSWMSFARKLKHAGMMVLAIDLRGHGDSTRKQDGSILNYKSFSDSEHQKSVFDIEAAVKFLRRKNHLNLALIGASIGANLALKYLAECQEAKAAILFSAGLNYRGIKALPLAKMLKENQKVFIVAAEDDMRSGESAGEAAKEIFDNLTIKRKQIKIFESGGHGTEILNAHQEFQDFLVRWLQQNID
jgi:alpha-beta hydrolase superfamily lysophospholipase